MIFRWNTNQWLILVYYTFCITMDVAALSARRGGQRGKVASVAIVGGGFAGLAIAQELSQVCDSLSVYDIFPAGKAGASSAAGGLLHPFAPRGNFVWKGLEGFQSTMSVLQRVKEAGLMEPGLLHYTDKSIQRPIYSMEDLKTWREACSLHPDLVQEVSISTYLQSTSSSIDPVNSSNTSPILGCISMKESAIINAPMYLRQMWKLIQQQCENSHWIEELCTYEHLQDTLCKNHDVVVIAGGFASMIFLGKMSPTFNVRYVQGRNLHYTQKSPLTESMTQPLLSGEYIVPRTITTVDKDPGLREMKHELIAGATHEHIKLPTDISTIIHRLQQEPNIRYDPASLDKAHTLLGERLKKLYPALDSQYVAAYVSEGVRLVTERTNLGRLPIVGKLNLPSSSPTSQSTDNVWVLTGLGSRGLVYHALMASYLKEAIVANDVHLIPRELHPSQHCKKTQHKKAENTR